jgi:hypothetical protein
MSISSDKIARAKKSMDLLTSRKWQYQRLIIDGKEQVPPDHLIEFRKDGNYIEHCSDGIVERSWKLSDSGTQITINMGRTASTALIMVNESRILLKGRIPLCTFVQRFEATMIAVEQEPSDKEKESRAGNS